MRAVMLAFLCLALPAAAQDLRQVYRDAKSYDELYAAARYALQAGLEKLPQGRALILPTLDLLSTSSGATSTRIETYTRNSANAPLLRDLHSYGYQLKFVQPIYKPKPGCSMTRPNSRSRRPKRPLDRQART